MEECRICCENIANNLIFTCVMCNYNCCINCYHIFFLTLSGEPECINCKYIINKVDLIDKLNIKWIFGEYMKNRNVLLLQKQYDLLPGTKNEADYIKIENNILEKRSNLLKERRLINNQLKVLNAELCQHMHYDKNIRCSYKCDGFLDVSYKCNICNKYTCMKCYSGMDNNWHKCCDNVINVYNISMPCPQCGVYICKDEGCDTINCINCNIFFNWADGTINNINNNINNAPSLLYINQLNISHLNEDDMIIFKGMYNHIVEFVKFNMNKLLLILNNFNKLDKFKLLRINYLNLKINQTQFNKQIIKLSKFENYRLYICNIILDAYYKAINIINNINCNNTNIIDELTNIIKITNNYIVNVNKYFKYINNIKIYHWFNLNDIDFFI
jgi:hypothetical protein